MAVHIIVELGRPRLIVRVASAENVGSGLVKYTNPFVERKVERKGISWNAKSYGKVHFKREQNDDRKRRVLKISRG